MKVLIVGLPLFAQKLAEDLSAFDAKNTYVACDTYYSLIGKLKYLFHLPSADIVHSINGTIYGSKVFEGTLKRNKKLMMHWVGTDVLKSAVDLKNNRVNMDFIDKAFHFCEPEWIKEELVSLGIQAKTLTFTALDLDREYVRPNPNSFSALSYIGKNREEFYGADRLIKLALDFPTTIFNVVGSTLSNYKLPDNINILGWAEDMDRHYEESIVYLRLTEHDGLSSSIIEALSRGCYVIWTMKYANSLQASDHVELKHHFGSLKNRFEQGALEANKEGMEHIKSNFDKPHVLRSLVITYQDLLSR